MKISKIGESNGILELECKEASPAYMNSLRRAIMNEVPTLAIEVVEFKNNSSIMNDEVVAHRLGLVALTTPTGDYALASPEEMQTQEFSARSSVTATLSAKGPCTVYAKDLKFADSKVQPVHPETIIVKLLAGQEIELIATAVLGKGKIHTKWSPGLVYYHEIPTIKGKSAAVAPEYKQELSEADALEARTSHFYFRVESWGQINPQEMLSIACEELNSSLKEIDSLLKA